MALLDDLAAAVLESRQRKELAETALSKAEKEKDEAEQKLIVEMANMGLDSFRNEFGLFSVSDPREFWSFDAARKDEAVAVIKTVAPQLVKETVNTQSLGGWIREEKKNGNGTMPDWWSALQPCLKVFVKPVLSVRK